MVDLRRERLLVQRNQTELQHDIGQTVLWACFNPALSEMDDTYNYPGGNLGRVYKKAFNLPVMWINNLEGNIDYSPDRTDLSDRVTVGISMNMARQCGMDDPEQDNVRVFDIFFYRDQWYDVTRWEIMGRNDTDDFIVAVDGVQVWPSESFVFEPSFPNALGDDMPIPDLPQGDIDASKIIVAPHDDMTEGNLQTVLEDIEDDLDEIAGATDADTLTWEPFS